MGLFKKDVSQTKRPEPEKTLAEIDRVLRPAVS